jgi:hypothetical protein
MSEVDTGSVVNDGGASTAPTVAAGSSSGSIDWRSALDEGLRSDPTLADIKDLNGLAKSYVHAQRMVGKDKLVIPGEGADPTEWDSFYEKLGRPQDGKYNLDPKGIIPDDMPFQPEAIDHFKKVFHEAGLSQKQAETVFKNYMQFAGEQHTNMMTTGQQQREQWVTDVKKEFGKAYDQKIDLAVRAVDTFGGEDMKKWLNETGLGDNPMFIKVFSKIGEKMQESLTQPGQSGGFTLTPDAARQEIARMQRDDKFMAAYLSPATEGHAEAVKKMHELYGFAYPEEVGS